MDASNGDKPKARWRLPRFHLISLLMGVLAAGWWLGMNLNRTCASIDTDAGLEPVFVWGFPVDVYASPGANYFLTVLENHYRAVLVDLTLGLAFTAYVMVTIERSLKRTADRPFGWRGPFRMPAVVCVWLVVVVLLTANSLGQPTGVSSLKYLDLAKVPVRAERVGDPTEVLVYRELFPDYRTYGWPLPAVKFRAYEINHGRLEDIDFVSFLADLAVAFAILLASLHVVEGLTRRKPRVSS